MVCDPMEMLWTAHVFRSLEGPKVQQWKKPASAISVVPCHDTWKVAIMAAGQQDAGRSEMIEAIVGRLRAEYDLKS